MTAYTFTPINIPQPIGSDVYVAADGIDTAGEVVGSYGYTDGDDDSYFHGFTATGSVGTTFDPPGSSNTNGIGITASGEIFGSYVDWENRQHGFVDINGAFQQIDVFLASSTIVDGVTNAGTIFGTYVDEFGFGISGFIDNNGSFTILDVPGASTTSISGLNAAGEIVGTYTDASGQAHGFADINGTFATIDPAGSISTSVAGVSATGEVAGNYENSSSVNNGFIDNNGVITTIVIPGATETGVSTINDAGEVVGYYADTLGNVHGFIEQNSVTIAIDVPGATETDINGVSDSGIITGFYNDSSYTQHGFVGVPEGLIVDGTLSDALQGSSPVALVTGTTISDPGKADLASASIRIANGGGSAVAGDQLFVNGQQGGTVAGGAVTVSWNVSTATLTLTGTASLATYQTLLGEVTYKDTGTDASSGGHPVRTVTWTVNDGTQNLVTTSQVTIDRAPVASNDTGLDVIGTPLAVTAASGVLAHDSDLDGDTLRVTAVAGQAGNVGVSVAGSYGHLTLNADGSYSYVANNGASAGSVDSFTYTVGDGNGGSATATLKITLDSPLQTLPLAVLTPAGQATPSGWTVSASGGDGGLTYTLASVAAHGTATVNANGTFGYTPAAGYSGTDSFQFKATDALGLSSVNTVSVGVWNPGYQIAQSLQLTASQSQYLSQAPAVAGSQTTWTWSGWVNLSNLALTNLFETISGSGSSASWSALRFDNGQLEFYDINGSGFTSHLLTNQQFSTNTWYQVTLVYDTTQAVAANRIELFVNGQQITSFAAQVDPSQNYAGVTGSTAARYLGFDARWPSLNEDLSGNLADVQFIDGQAVSASALGQTVNGQWQPIAYTGSYGTNGYHLTFGSGAIGADASGNGNNWTPVNLSAANVSAQSPSGVPVALTLDNGLAVNAGSSDPISGATVRITGGFTGDGDVLSVNTSGTAITASWNAATETLTLAGTDSAANYQAVLDAVVFSSTASDPTHGGANPTRIATWQVTDATNGNLSTAQSEAIDISPPPASIVVSGTSAEALQGGSAVTLLSAPASITDGSSTTLSSASIRIANGGGSAVAGDQLFVNGQQGGTVAGGAVTVSWNVSTATLTLTGTASLATYQTLLGEVTYKDTGTDASSGGHPVRTVTWTVNDGTQNLVTTSQVTIDRAPVASNDTGLDVIGTPLAVTAASGVLAHDSDLDGDTLRVTAVAGQAGNVGVSVAGSYGHLTLNADGSYSYVANNGASAGSVDSFTYTVGDGNGGSATATLKITLDSPLQTLPLAVLTPAGQATPSGWTVSASGGDGGLTYTLASVAAHGTATVNANGTFGYTPAAGYSGTDSFQFKATDALGLSSVNTVSVGVWNPGYQIAQSLQLTASQSQYLSQAPAVAGSQTTWTWSGWVNLSNLALTNLFETISGSGSSASWSALRFDNGQLEFYDINGSGFTSHLLTNQQFSTNTWYQVTLVYDTTQAVAANRIELFVNGQQITSFAAQVDPSQNYAGVTGSTAARYLGFDARWPSLNEDLSGNLADVQFIDGQAVSASALGQTVNGQWQPIAYTGSYGTNGYHLTFGSGAIGTDASGNGNNWTPVNLNAANVSAQSPSSSIVQIAQSLQLTASQSQYLSQAPAVAGSQTTWTWSGWVNLSNLALTNLFETISGSGSSASWSALRFDNGQLEFYDINGSGFTSHLLTNQQFSTNTWYQVTLVYDTTQAVAANRIELFVNGQQITSFAAQVDPSQNYAGVTGSTAARYLGFDARWPSLNEDLSGNLADVQFIDGQAVSASALGQTVNGQWQPIAYTGSYGTNGYHLTFGSGAIGADASGNGNNWTPVNLNAANVSAQSPSSSIVQIAQSLQLTASQSQYLSQAPAVAGSQTTWTWSGWVNLSNLALTNLFETISGSGSSASWSALRFDNGQLEFYDINGSGFTSHLLTNQQFSTNTWYQVTLVYDTTQAVAANRIELFVNGQQITSFAAQVDPSQNYAGVTGSTAARYLGFDARWPSLNEDLSGNLADVQFIDGQAVSASALGQTVNGQWQPIAYTGSYGTNGYHLTFGSGAIGADASGNGNNWTPVNLSAANVSAQSPSGVPVALTLDNGLAVNAGSSDPISGATVRITGGFTGDGDVLSVNTSGTAITASWNAATETLTLAGTDSAANYQAVLDAVVFSSTASDPTHGGANPTRIATWQVTDATNGNLSAVQSETIDLSPAYATGGSHAQGTSATSDGPITIDNGSMVEIGAPSASGIMFAGAAGTLQLDQSSTFGGQISGFNGQDQIDLRDIGFDANATLGYAPNAGNTGGTLSATDGSHIADIALLGSYIASSFVAASDGYGGTLVTDQPTSSNQQTSFLATPTPSHA